MTGKEKRLSWDISSHVFVLAVLFFIGAIVLMTVLVLASSTSSLLMTKVVPYDFSVQEAIGIVVDSDSLHLGGGPTGSILQRSLEINSTRDALVHIESNGPGILVVEKNDFFLSKDSFEQVAFSLTIPDDLPEGHYEGVIIVKFLDPKQHLNNSRGEY